MPRKIDIFKPDGVKSLIEPADFLPHIPTETSGKHPLADRPDRRLRVTGPGSGYFRLTGFEGHRRLMPKSSKNERRRRGKRRMGNPACATPPGPGVFRPPDRSGGLHRPKHRPGPAKLRRVQQENKIASAARSPDSPRLRIHGSSGFESVLRMNFFERAGRRSLSTTIGRLAGAI